ncbi:hypothetical protein GMOD_00001953 [Pyrenophora seminiperda CCB06]|uniref:Uncharacterized protein n=1 Tax=Pyrenophora seminiperda CCB06 TaxID=1302712 RepID=A0A3M7LWH2_9PLEO|nr:hypothetical protein GMOD_00001953 [Pyrenophora seminiperda CCB06]
MPPSLAVLDHLRSRSAPSHKFGTICSVVPKHLTESQVCIPYTAQTQSIGRVGLEVAVKVESATDVLPSQTTPRDAIYTLSIASAHAATPVYGP